MKQNNTLNIDEIYEEIKLSNYNLESIVSGDVVAPQEIKQKIDLLISYDTNFYSNLLHKLIGEDFTEPEARQLWFEILEHKYKVSEKLGRNIGIKVATLDYLENIKGIIKSPRIIEEEEFIKTVKMATIDPLTQLYNRQHFMSLLRQKIREKTQFCLAFLDLDGFKKYNDKEGHQAGDILLQEFAVTLKLKFNSEKEFVGRYGGDEFMVCILQTDKKNAQNRLDIFRQEVKNQFASIGITVSIGVCEYPYDAGSLDELVEKVDELLYRVKEFGGDKVFRLRTVFFYYYPDDNYQPKEVSVVGDFNNWNRKQGIMEFVSSNKYWCKKMLLKPGTYRYKFLLDSNIWVIDKNSKFFADDGFGGQCSVIVVLER